MKNRKTVVVAFLLVATMLLGVGYATLSDTLTIEGTAKVSPEIDSHIFFSAAEAGDTTNSAAVDSTDNDKATFAVTSLKEKGDTATFAFTIKNTSPDLKVTVTPTVANGNETYFTVTTDNTSYTISNNGDVTITVTVTLNGTPTDVTSETFTITLNATTTTN